VNGPNTQFDLLSPGSFGHGGAFGTGASIDPKNELVIIFLAQMNDGTAQMPSHALSQIADSALR
jgi:CubicO group peptidase (beta-lactamase class C family)